MEEKDEGNRARSWLADCTLDVARDMATSTACPIIAHPSRCMCEDGAKLKHKFVFNTGAGYSTTAWRSRTSGKIETGVDNFI